MESGKTVFPEDAGKGTDVRSTDFPDLPEEWDKQ